MVDALAGKPMKDVVSCDKRRVGANNRKNRRSPNRNPNYVQKA